MRDNKLIIALGANIKNPNGLHPIDTCEKAILELSKYSIKIIKGSSWYISAPIPKSNQPNYYNSVIKCSTKLNERTVLKVINIIEKKLGRIKQKNNFSRCIDLDIIDFNNRVKKSLMLTIPHPRSHKRKFVLLPILEINPFWIHPIKKRNVKNLLETTNRQVVLKINKKNIDFVTK